MKSCFIVIAALLFFALPLSAQSGKPATHDFPEEIGAPQPSIKTMFPEVRTTHEMVGGGNNFVTEAGMRMLRAGGNAVDAGIAAVLAAAVTEEDHFSMGGEMPLLIKLQGKPVEAVSGVGVTPAKATIEFFKNRPLEPDETADRKPPIPAHGILATTTPGMFDGAMLALETFGTMSFAQVAAPAIELADGFPTTEVFADTLQTSAQGMLRWPLSVKYFFNVNGRLPARGEIFHQPDLAKTLRAMVGVEQKTSGGRSAQMEAVRNYFYRGPIAQEMGAFSEANGGLLTYSDMAAFHAEVDKPRSTIFHGYEIVKPGFWSQGPVLLEMFNLLESYDLKSMKHNSPEYLHVVLEAAKLAFADRDMYYGDPKFSKIPEETLLSKDYASERRKLIDPTKASMESRPGSIAGYHIPMPDGKTANIDVKDTTCVDVVDREGNVFSATPSGAWVPAVMAGTTGIAYGTRLQSILTIPGHPNVIQAGKRPRVTLSPTIILKDGEPVIAISTPGADNQDQALLQVILNMIVFDMSPQEAVEAPRFQTEAFYSSFGMHNYTPGKVNLESRIPKTTTDKLSSLGHIVTVTGPWSNVSGPVVIKIGDGILEGGADPRRNRFIEGD
ncbi:MAG TPA: gamma-glutamyltransferase family protein [Candidatus Acidoferrum sp.]|nr:gamma-glutamyltransferase family protein [Candidatus Acidoferrum sp.]